MAEYVVNPDVVFLAISAFDARLNYNGMFGCFFYTVKCWMCVQDGLPKVGSQEGIGFSIWWTSIAYVLIF